MKAPVATSKWFFKLEDYPLMEYANDLAATQLYPGRRILHEKLEERFSSLHKAGIENVQQLADTLKSKKKLVQLSDTSGVNVEYLSMLNRQLHMLKPKIVKLSEFPGIDESTFQALEEADIVNTVQLFEQGALPAQRKKIAKTTGLSLNEVNEIAKLADISRIHGCGPVFCRIFFDTGIDTVEEIAASDAPTLYNALSRINDKKQYTKANFTVNDLEMTVNFANRLPKILAF